jgi:hypothetical protein
MSTPGVYEGTYGTGWDTPSSFQTAEEASETPPMDADEDGDGDGDSWVGPLCVCVCGVVMWCAYLTH